MPAIQRRKLSSPDIFPLLVLAGESFHHERLPEARRCLQPRRDWRGPLQTACGSDAACCVATRRTVSLYARSPRPAELRRFSGSRSQCLVGALAVPRIRQYAASRAIFPGFSHAEKPVIQNEPRLSRRKFRKICAACGFREHLCFAACTKSGHRLVNGLHSLEITPDKFVWF